MAQVAEQSKFRQWTREEPWRPSAISTFRSFATMHESARKGGLSADESTAFCKGPTAGEFADKVVLGLEAAAKAVGCDVCELTPSVVGGLPGAGGKIGGNADAFVFASTNSVVLGLVRADGLVTPVVLNDRAVLVQKGHGPLAVLYDTTTDFARLVRDSLTQRSFV